MTKRAPTKPPKHVNTPLLEQAMLHLLAAYGESRSLEELRKQPIDFLTIVLKIAQAQHFTLEDVQRRWNEVSEGKA